MNQAAVGWVEHGDFHAKPNFQKNAIECSHAFGLFQYVLLLEEGWCSGTMRALIDEEKGILYENE